MEYFPVKGRRNGTVCLRKCVFLVSQWSSGPGWVIKNILLDIFVFFINVSFYLFYSVIVLGTVILLPKGVTLYIFTLFPCLCVQKIVIHEQYYFGDVFILDMCNTDHVFWTHRRQVIMSESAKCIVLWQQYTKDVENWLTLYVRRELSREKSLNWRNRYVSGMYLPLDK